MTEGPSEACVAPRSFSASFKNNWRNREKSDMNKKEKIEKKQKNSHQWGVGALVSLLVSQEQEWGALEMEVLETVRFEGFKEGLSFFSKKTWWKIYFVEVKPHRVFFLGIPFRFLLGNGSSTLLILNSKSNVCPNMAFYISAWKTVVYSLPTVSKMLIDLNRWWFHIKNLKTAINVYITAHNYKIVAYSMFRQRFCNRWYE